MSSSFPDFIDVNLLFILMQLKINHILWPNPVQLSLVGKVRIYGEVIFFAHHEEDTMSSIPPKAWLLFPSMHAKNWTQPSRRPHMLI